MKIINFGTLYEALNKKCDDGMKSLKTIIKEQYENLYLIRRLSLYELKQAYAGNLLGLLWVF